MAEPRRESTSSLQRKKPPWLRLDIPTTQMSLDEPPTFVQVFFLAKSHPPYCHLVLLFLSWLVLTLFICLLTHVAGEEAGVPAQYQHASGDLSPPVATPRPLWQPAACLTTPVIHHSDHKEVKAVCNIALNFYIDILMCDASFTEMHANMVVFLLLFFFIFYFYIWQTTVCVSRLQIMKLNAM